MDLRRFWKAILRIAFSLVCAIVFYIAWMAAFILAARLDSPVLETILWLLAPVITAAGFATGIAVRERLAGTKRSCFLHIFLWPLIGCAVGAGLVYSLGPMLMVSAIFFTGTASMALREVVGCFRGGEPATS
ncbi:MAG: hypothetical protein PVH95_03390 [Anaerolineae bacterium]|jgi:hypothetical protein